LKCQYCEGSVDLPFKCPFCGGYFCYDHRLPENHACPELLKIAHRREEYTSVYEKAPPTEERSYGYMPDFRTRSHWFGSTEILHLTAGALMVMAVGLSFVLQLGFFLLREIELWVGAALVFTSVCILHELAHKAVAKIYGLWAEFRLNLLGVLVTMLSIVSPIKIVSPGSVMISGEADKKIVGMTAFAGPFTNMVLSSLFSASSFFAPNSSLSLIMILGAMLSSSMSLFNLIPFNILDGAKIFWWNRKAWAICFFASLILTLIVTITFSTF